MPVCSVTPAAIAAEVDPAAIDLARVRRPSGDAPHPERIPVIQIADEPPPW